MTFNQFNLLPALMTAIDEQGYSSATPIQVKSIPLILEGKDIFATAQTGTGKTASFALPLLQLIAGKRSKVKPRIIKALILAPTRELVIQVHKNFADYGKHLPIVSELVYGGVSVNTQINRLRGGADILVATSGRLLDLIHQKKIDLSQVEFFVLDEADRMLDMGFIHDIHRIIKLLPKQRQNLLFSATYSKEIKTLSNKLLNQPVEVAVARENATANNVSQRVYPIKKENKRELLAWLIGNGHWHQVLIFVRTKHGADRLCKQLIKDGISCMALHGNKSQGARVRALEGFKSGDVTALIATDIAARGLDIELLPHVVNFDLPAVAEDYVHRIGRTGRASAKGEAISFVSAEEAPLLVSIEKLLKINIPQVTDTGYETVSLVVDKSQKNKAKPVANRTRKPRKNNYSTHNNKSSVRKARVK